MSYLNGIISAPINASDPYYVMGVGQHNGWWDITHICTHLSINKWSYNKPYQHSSPIELSVPPVGLGISFSPRLYDPNETPLAFAHNASYEKPIAKIHWARLTDFIGYNHNAKPPVSMTNASGGEVEWNRSVDSEGFIKFSIDGGNLPIYGISCVIPNAYIMPIAECFITANIFKEDKYTLVEKHVLSDSKFGGSPEIPLNRTLPHGIYYVYFELDSYLYKPIPTDPLRRYLFSFPDDPQACPNPVKLRIHNTPIYDFNIVGYRSSHIVGITYTKWTNSNYIEISSGLAGFSKRFGFETKLEIINKSGNPVTFTLTRDNLKYDSTWKDEEVEVSYPAKDRSGVADTSVWNYSNKTLIVQPGVTTYVNASYFYPVESDLDMPLGIRNVSFAILYKGVQFSNGNIDIRTL